MPAAAPVQSVASLAVTTTVGDMPVDIRDAKTDDYDDLFVAFSRIVGRVRASRRPTP